MPTSSHLAQRVHYSSPVPHQPVIISQRKQKASEMLAEKAEGKQEHPEVVSDAPLLPCTLLISCCMIDSLGNSIRTPAFLAPQQCSYPKCRAGCINKCSGCKDSYGVPEAGCTSHAGGSGTGARRIMPSMGKQEARE